MISLTPQKKKPRARKKKPWAVYDIEGANWIEHVVSASYYKDEDGLDELHYFKHVGEFVEYLFKDGNPIEEVWCHFGAIYDFMFVIKECVEFGYADITKMVPRGNGLLMFDIQRNDKTVTFRDSSAILPFGLDSITKNFGVTHEKLKMDRTKITHDTPEVRRYLKNDVVGLYESIEKFMEWGPIKEVGMKTTIASQSIQILRKYLPCEIPSLSKGADQFIRQGYFGGRTEIFKPLYDDPSKDINYYDINSLYPYCMKELLFPVVPKGVQSTFDMGSTVGYVECEVFIPEMYSPPLPVVQEIRKTKKLIFPTGKVRGVWSSLELEYASKFGVVILKVYRVFAFEKLVPVFKEFVDTMYDIRSKSEKVSVDNVLAKLILNSCYGRMGLDRNRASLEFDDGQDGFKPKYELAARGGGSIRIGEVQSFAKNAFSHVGIAAWVTSGARILNHQKQHELDYKVWYTDTDSFFTPKKLKESGKLGDLKLEYPLKRACFLLPKTYIMEANDEIFKVVEESGKVFNTDKKVAMKGFDKMQVNGFTFDDFQQALEGDFQRLKAKTPAKMARMRSAFQKGEVLAMMKESTKQVRSKYDKRRIIKTRRQEYDTEPLVVKDGEVINL